MALSPRQLSTVADRLLPFPAFATRMGPGRSCYGRCTALDACRQGRHPDPSAESRDSQSVKTVEESSGICGYDAHKHIKGRKRHLLVDTLGIPISIYVTPADTHDTKGARCLLAGLKFFVPRLKKIWADAAYRGQELAEWCQATGDWELEVVERPSGTRGFSVVPRRWVVERTFSWISRNRRMSKDYERKVQTSETLIQVAMIRLLPGVG
jgi:putative transposase